MNGERNDTMRCEIWNDEEIGTIKRETWQHKVRHDTIRPMT